MNAPSTHFDRAQRDACGVFGPGARETFAEQYPEEPHLLSHSIICHPLLELDALASLAEALPEASIEYNRGDLPVGVNGKPEANGLSIGETIRRIAETGSWAVLKNIEQDLRYESLLGDCLEELRGDIEAKTGPMLTPQGFVFISSPKSVTPYHFDPEHNILLQVRGSKTMTQFPAGDARLAPDEVHESYHAGGPRELVWDEVFMAFAKPFAIGPGEAVYVPVMAPHFVRNGPEPSVSLSITWRSEWSYAESDARGLNHMLRKAGFSPAAPGRWPQTNSAKALAFRALRKLGLAPRP